ncbi:hypothetical protein Pint_09555 [Pistacia integerrima]|uniref:Uncharacterized protein n=1 Tax=Pistacia integerrima TaxID=434235 RepID=A0ACC0XFV8_9ROSI|nr:hypothetical protein Pint_09555 [Pistacia integerrima]
MLSLRNNRLSGVITGELGKLGQLRYIWLASNKLTGFLPQEYEQLTNLKE